MEQSHAHPFCFQPGRAARASLSRQGLKHHSLDPERLPKLDVIGSVVGVRSFSDEAGFSTEVKGRRCNNAVYNHEAIMLPLMSDPALIFRKVAEQYQAVTPDMWITREQAATIDRVIDDICFGREVSVLKAAVKLEFVPVSSIKALHPVRCCEWFCYFIEELHTQMHEQSRFHIAPMRAVELLYNLDCDAEFFSQPLISMSMVSYDDSILKSRATFERRVGARIDMCLQTTECYDWTIY